MSLEEPILPDMPMVAYSLTCIGKFKCGYLCQSKWEILNFKLIFFLHVWLVNVVFPLSFPCILIRLKRIYWLLKKNGTHSLVIGIILLKICDLRIIALTRAAWWFVYACKYDDPWRRWNSATTFLWWACFDSSWL